LNRWLNAFCQAPDGVALALNFELEIDKRVDDVREWAQEVTGPDWKWVVKILSGNDTLATGAHQAGPYIPKEIIFDFSIYRTIEFSESAKDVFGAHRLTRGIK